MTTKCDWTYRVTTTRRDDSTLDYQYWLNAQQAHEAACRDEAVGNTPVTVERRFRDGGAWQVIPADALEQLAQQETFDNTSPDA